MTRRTLGFAGAGVFGVSCATFCANSGLGQHHTLATDDQKYEQIADTLLQANRVVVFTGAGISAESGISTFRAPDTGFWSNKLTLLYYGTPVGWLSK